MAFPNRTFFRILALYKMSFSLLWEAYDENDLVSVKCKKRNTLYFIVSWSTSPPCGHSQLYEYDIHALFHCRVCSQINCLWTWGKYYCVERCPPQKLLILPLIPSLPIYPLIIMISLGFPILKKHEICFYIGRFGTKFFFQSGKKHFLS